MPQHVIERDIPDAGSLSPDELQTISQKSCSVLRSMRARGEMGQSYVTGDRIYCVSIAPDENLTAMAWFAKDAGVD